MSTMAVMRWGPPEGFLTKQDGFKYFTEHRCLEYAHDLQYIKFLLKLDHLVASIYSEGDTLYIVRAQQVQYLF